VAPGVVSASNRNEYQVYFLGGKGGRCRLTTLPTLCADWLEIWEPQPRGTLKASLGQYRDLFYSTSLKHTDTLEIANFFLKIS